MLGRRGRLVLLVATFAIVLGACSSASETIAERIVEGQEGVSDVDINADDGTFSFNVDTEDGSATVEIGGGEVPADFPAPVPPGGTVTASMVSTDGANAGWTLGLEYEGDRVDEIAAVYEEWMLSQGWEPQKIEQTAPIRSTSMYGVGDESGTVVTVAFDDGKTSVVVIING